MTKIDESILDSLLSGLASLTQLACLSSCSVTSAAVSDCNSALRAAPKLMELIRVGSMVAVIAFTETSSGMSAVLSGFGESAESVRSEDLLSWFVLDGEVIPLYFDQQTL